MFPWDPSCVGSNFCYMVPLNDLYLLHNASLIQNDESYPEMASLDVQMHLLVWVHTSVSVVPLVAQTPCVLGVS